MERYEDPVPQMNRSTSKEFEASNFPISNTLEQKNQSLGQIIDMKKQSLPEPTLSRGSTYVSRYLKGHKIDPSSKGTNTNTRVQIS